MSYRYLLALALAAGISSEASAQFTTFIPPQSKAVDSVKTAVATQQRASVASGRVMCGLTLRQVPQWAVSDPPGLMLRLIRASQRSALRRPNRRL